MKKFIFTAVVAIVGWFGAQAQSMPAPERYNSFLEQIASLEPEKAEFLMNATMESLVDNPKGYRQMMELAEKRFSDAADPLHNETLYMIVINHALEKYVLSSTEKEKQRLLLAGAKKNMIGTTAVDFDYVTPGDKTVHHLKDLKADNILVYFNNPDCESCELVKQRLEENEFINKLVNEKKLIVLAIYPYDDQKLWKKTNYPKMMINGWNQSHNIEYGELYDLPTLPCFYLLDRNYKVLIKNEGSLNKVEALLKQLNMPQEVGPAPELPVTKQEEKSNKPIIKRDKQKTEIIPAPADDPKVARSEELLSMFLENKSQELYDSLSDDMKAKLEPNTFEGAISQIESKVGKYQNHETWNIQKFQGMNAYTTLVNFEKSPLGLLIIYDETGKLFGFKLVPPQVVKPEE